MKAAAIFCVLLLISAVYSAAHLYADNEDNRLQQLVDQAQAGATIVIPAGQYTGKLTIDKPLVVIADAGATLTNSDSNSAVRITHDNVTLVGLHIVQLAHGDSSAIELSANRATLKQLVIQTRGYGIVLRKANKNTIEKTKVSWLDDEDKAPVKMSQKRNGIDLFQSHDNIILENAISSMNDGIYLESSHRNKVEGNKIAFSRYGVHCMYTNGTIVSDNIGKYNITGAMVMGVNDAIVKNNTFTKQSESVMSQGILLFDVQTSLIEGNRVEGNRVGLYMELSDHNILRNNDVIRNFVGIQLLQSKGNRFTANRFLANVSEAEATESSDNKLHGNEWDAFRGLDVTGDGYSDIAYKMNPFFKRLTDDTPAFQLFFQSPGMLFLESLFTAGQAAWSVDTAPVISGKDASVLSSPQMDGDGTIILALFLLLISLTLFTMGVKRR